MPELRSKLFSNPIQPKLEACLVDDAAHITQGIRSDHVKLIQTALNRLSAGAGRENFSLRVDGWYGPKTATAVKQYKSKPSRDIRQSWQKTPDDIVGKRTMRSLDDEMEILENETPAYSGLVAFDDAGAPHDHTKCPDSPWGGSDHRVKHYATPMNPIGTRRKINVGGWFETQYLGFEDFVPDPQRDPSFREGRAHRSFIHTISSGDVSDICFRATPLDDYMKTEVRRIAMLGCRLTYAGPTASPYTVSFESFMAYFRSLGPIIEQGVVFDKGDPPDPPDQPGSQGTQYVVVSILKPGGRP